MSAAVDAGPRDAREGGRWTPAQRLKNDAIYAVAAAALAIAERLPTGALRAAGRALGALAWAAAPRLRRLAIANVARALPERDAASLARAAYGRLGERLGEAVAALDPRRPLSLLPLLPGARACLEEALGDGRGVVFASAHLGPWERVAASIAAAGFPLTVVAREPYDPRFAGLYRRLREDRGVRAVYRGAPAAGVALVRVLRRGGLLGVPMDLASRVASIDVPFLGTPAPTAIGPARLARRTGAAVVVGTAAPGPDGALGIDFTRIDAGGASEAELTARVNDELSRRIRALPEEWVWMHRRWGRRIIGE